MVVHGALLVFFLIGGFLAWRWPQADLGAPGHRGVEHRHRAGRLRLPGHRDREVLPPRGGETPYAAGYIEHYLDGRLWPEGATPTVEKIGFALVVISYIGFFILRHRRKAAGQAKVRGDSVGPRT